MHKIDIFNVPISHRSGIKDKQKFENYLLSALLHDSLFPKTFSWPPPTNHVKWSEYNESLVRRGEILIGFDVIDNWDKELKDMNRDKVGEPFQYPNTFLLLLACQSVISSSLSANRGYCKRTCQRKIAINPRYSTINRRINRLDIKVIDDGGKNSKTTIS